MRNSAVAWVCASYLVLFKQKTAYEMRISDWSSDVCSSDLFVLQRLGRSNGGHGKRSRDYQEKRPLHGGLSFAVIRMICKDARGTPQLVGQHEPRHHMRPGRKTEGNQKIRPLQQRLTETVSRAATEEAITEPQVEPCLKMAGEY